jgi:hypothetical protein
MSLPAPLRLAHRNIAGAAGVASGRVGAWRGADARDTCPAASRHPRESGLELIGVGDNFKPIAIGAVIVLAVVPDAYRGRFLRALEARRLGRLPRRALAAARWADPYGKAGIGRTIS